MGRYYRQLLNAVASGGTAVPFSPDDIASLKIWLEGDTGTYQTRNALSTAASADGDPVGSWDNQVAGQNDAFTMDNTYRPALKTGVNGINSLPAIQFDGTTDKFSHHTAGGIEFDPGATGLTVFAVLKTAGSVPANSTIAASGGAGGTSSIRWALAAGSDASQGRGWGGAAAGTNLLTWTLSTSTTYLLVWKKDTAEWTFRKNGAASGAAIADASMPGNPFELVIGSESTAGAYHFNGLLAALLIYAEPLSAGDITDVEGYLNDKYAVY